MTSTPTDTPPAAIEVAENIDIRMVRDLDLRRAKALAHALKFLDFAAGEGLICNDIDAADLYNDALMALGIEDSDHVGAAIEEVIEHPECYTLIDRFEALPAIIAALPSLPASNGDAAPHSKAAEANSGCWAKAKPDEPMFIILGRDPDGANIVRLWAQRRSAAGDPEHGDPVLALADAMDAWRAAGNLPASAPSSEDYPPLPASNAASDAEVEEASMSAAIAAYPLGYDFPEREAFVKGFLAALAKTRPEIGGGDHGGI